MIGLVSFGPRLVWWDTQDYVCVCVCFLNKMMNLVLSFMSEARLSPVSALLFWVTFCVNKINRPRLFLWNGISSVFCDKQSNEIKYRLSITFLL